MAGWSTRHHSETSRDINQKDASGNHKFILTPRALFAPDGTILPCLDKSKLIHLLNKLATAETPQEDQQPENRMDTTPDAPSRKIALVEGMVLVQQMAKKPATIVTIIDLSECFNDRLMSLTRDYDEIILVLTHTGTILWRVLPGIKEGKEEHQPSIRSEMAQP